MAKKKQTEQPAAQPMVQAAPMAPQPVKVAFDAWWAMNETKIPVQHHKEIILADFRARGLSLKETIKSYNEALNKYGLKLK
jgi:hypothetical protein